MLEGIKNKFTGFGFMTQKAQNTELDCLFPLDLALSRFRDWYITDLYKRILTDCYNRAQGIKEEDKAMFWDSFIITAQPEGLITLLADAMCKKQKIFIVYKAKVVSQADDTERAEIEEKIKNKKVLKNEVVCDFTDFIKTDLLRLYSSLIYNVLNTANTGLNISKAAQIKIDNLRNAIAEANATDPINQAKTINRGIKDGKSVLLDSKDIVELPNFDITPTEKSITLINGLIANVLGGFPLSYINGALAEGSISTTGESDALAIERALQYYFHSIFKPTVDGLTGSDITFKTENWRKLEAVAGLLPLVETSEIIPQAFKDKFVNEVFG